MIITFDITAEEFNAALAAAPELPALTDEELNAMERDLLDHEAELADLKARHDHAMWAR